MIRKDVLVSECSGGKFEEVLKERLSDLLLGFRDNVTMPEWFLD